MPYYDDGFTRYDSGARYDQAPSPRNKKPMANIAINTAKLPIPERILKGQHIISMSTNNPNVPGNTAVLTAFANLQADLVAANENHMHALAMLDKAMAVRDNTLAAWNGGIVTLAAFTQSATGGSEEKILSTGFDVRKAPSPPPPVGAPGPLTVKLNGSPGVTLISWPPVAEARSYLVEQSPAPITETSWAQVDTPAKASCKLDGAEPGTVYWFRVAAVTRKGSSPWSGPAIRPVV